MRKRQELQWSFWKNLDFKYTATKKRITEEEQMEQKYQYNTVEEADSGIYKMERLSLLQMTRTEKMKET